jgi:hypothetical protein
VLADNNGSNLVAITYVMGVKVDTDAEFVEMEMDIVHKLSKIGLYMGVKHTVGGQTICQVKIV